MSPKYPRTPHLPWSPGGTKDDRRIQSVDQFLNTPIIITQKMDGSNVCLESDSVYARSHAQAPNHPSFDALKALHAELKYNIPEGYQIFCEWLYAQHSIKYTKLPSYLMMFGVRDLKNNTWASWEEVNDFWSVELKIITVPFFISGIIESESEMKSIIDIYIKIPNLYGECTEGIVIRKASEFLDSEFDISLAKWVRKNHVQTDDHWKSQSIIKNGLKHES